MNGLSDVVKTVSRYATGPLVIFGIYLFTHADRSHGVGFAGGLIIALTVMMLILSFGWRRAQYTLPPVKVQTAGLFSLLAMTATMTAMTYASTICFSVPAFISLYPVLIQMLNVFLCLGTAFAFISIFYVLSRGK
ncbi:MAG: hypothetical protein NTU66_02275 [Elusimicrobia bacterium]|nr:hypothetical protein [Elusimicrobiota bacterium]